MITDEQIDAIPFVSSQLYFYNGYGFDPKYSLRQFARKVLAVASLPDWISVKDRMPEPGMLIVKRWKNGSVWAGNYTGGAKDSGFDEWFQLPVD